jgi:uncharacterized protein YjiS (DUF1127 family)
MSHSRANQVLPVCLGRCRRWIAFALKLRKLTIRNGIADLRAMNDRLLADIGLTRQQVEYMARHDRWPSFRNPVQDGTVVSHVASAPNHIAFYALDQVGPGPSLT